MNELLSSRSGLGTKLDPGDNETFELNKLHMIWWLAEQLSAF
jgi:hypothetical protein